jgi:hypothetical protein
MDKSQKYAGPAPTSGVASYDMKPLKNEFMASSGPTKDRLAQREEKKSTQSTMSKGYKPKLKATDAQMRDYERNKPVNTPAGRARYADKAPKINLRKAYQD